MEAVGADTETHHGRVGALPRTSPQAGLGHGHKQTHSDRPCIAPAILPASGISGNLSADQSEAMAPWRQDKPASLVGNAAPEPADSQRRGAPEAPDGSCLLLL
ncbi:hypothetical protein TARUN_4758 [Trichoderma arundinaceum]|uniref:Uncharacterized protein n=1 Tax=Trichoderma arundinaceum TaxID=490622 RepID=A0A395NMZ8_TRIAR|nr:hypothetical protein TARUN_4758 [Trichoderma arundinaceum]